jgi:hypothetical protein
MVAEYARRVLRVSGTHIYYSVGDDATLDSDLYVSTLRQDLISEFGAGHDQLFTPGAPLSQECGYRGMLFFAGRWSDFPNFLDGLNRDCVNDMPVHLVADDSVNRYMAKTTIRPDAPGNLALTYISKATLATCDQLQARMATDGTSSRFLRWVQAPKLLGPPRCLGSGGLPVGERVGLAYDSTASWTATPRRPRPAVRAEDGETSLRRPSARADAACPSSSRSLVVHTTLDDLRGGRPCSPPPLRATAGC